MTSVDNTTLSSLVDWAGTEETRWGSGSEEGEDDEIYFWTCWTSYLQRSHAISMWVSKILLVPRNYTESWTHRPSLDLGVIRWYMEKVWMRPAKLKTTKIVDWDLEKNRFQRKAEKEEPIKQKLEM